MTIQVKETSLNVVNMWTRMPFKYGIVTLTALPHLFVRVTAEVNGRLVEGLAADGLAPKWFTKDPDKTIENELAEMMAVIQAACSHAHRIGAAESVFDWWLQLYHAQKDWGNQRGYPALLWNFGTSLLERAALDAFCRASETPLAQAVRDNTLGMRLDGVHGELAGSTPRDWLPAQPTRRMGARHTVGLADPLTEADIPPEGLVEDGLPQSLEACIRQYDLRYFKIKIPADADAAIHRLRGVAEVLQRECGGFAFTLDGNEFFTDIERFRALWDTLQRDSIIAAWFKEGLLFLEQPLHRDVALTAQATAAFANWPERPPIIIDESDGENESLPHALERGYAGTSHKNCKGVFKGIANACLTVQRRRQDPAGRYAFSGEDLANVGPVALLQNLAVTSVLGLEHVEMNGHHYFPGLSVFPDHVQEAVLASHGDLYHGHQRANGAFPSLTIRGGEIALDSVLGAPFGYQIAIDPERFTPLEEWRFESLGLPPRDSAAPRS
ncbi:MAG: hypothetical protein ACLFV4_04865 [Candidatus Hydrogenedentota bacterium]